MTEFDRITVNPARMNGQPCIRNMRLTVRRVIGILAAYSDREEIRQDYPELEDEDIRQALRYSYKDLERGAAVTVQENRIRVRKLPFSFEKSCAG